MFINKKFAISFFLFVLVGSAHSQCIPVAGLQFEKISKRELIASKNGKNFAVLSVSEYDSIDVWSDSIPEKISIFRFFSEELCNSGAESRFHIDGKLFFLQRIKLFK